MHKICGVASTFVKDKQRIAALVMLIGSVIGLLASFVLSVETLLLASNKNAILSCSINAVMNCATVANHWSATVFGVPNSFFGMMAMSVMVTISVSLLAGVKFPRWFIWAMCGGIALGMMATLWMLYMSLFVIGVLCPWCLVLDIGMALIVFGVVRYVSMAKIIHCSLINKAVKNGWDVMILASVIVGIVALVAWKTV